MNTAEEATVNDYDPGKASPSSGDPRKYVAVLDYVRGLLDTGDLAPGQPTPTIGALTERFGCTRQTAAKALDLLAAEGALVRYAGLGYYVTGEPS